MVPVRLESLTIRRYRHLREPVTLTLDGGVVVLVGRNGTGKTNLLRLLDAVTRLDFRELERDPNPLDIAFALTWGPLRLELGLQCVPAPEGGEVRWSYAGTLSDGQQHHVSLRSDAVGPGGRGGPSPGSRGFRPGLAAFASAGQGVERWAEPLLGSPSIKSLSPATGRFDEALGAFDAITSVQSPGHASATVFGQPTGWGDPSFVPTAVGWALAMRPRDQRSLAIEGADLPWLEQAARVCGFRALTCTAQLDREQPAGEWVNATYAPFGFRARLADGATIAHHDFSFGQKRIVAFFWYLACVRDEGAAVIADELVNGMHHAAVHELVRALDGLQAFVAGQNPLLFDFLEYPTAAQFRRRVVLCGAGPSGGWSWRNPTEGEAERFFRAHDIGYQHVHEILRDEGLW